MLIDGAGQIRGEANPLGLYDFHPGADISVIQGSGLGGTSLVNANVVYGPDHEVFDDPQWPQGIRDSRDAGKLQQYFDRVRNTLFAGQHPNGMDLSKIRALSKGAQGVTGSDFGLLDIAVNFKFEGPNNWGVQQRKCINCGDCVTGCNVGAKNSLDTNYLAIAKSGGAAIFTQVEVRFIELDPNGGYLLHYVRRGVDDDQAEEGVIRAKQKVVVSAGSLGSSGIILRSRERGLGMPETAGSRFSGNGDFFGLAYDGDSRTDTLGWGNHPDSDRARRIQTVPGAPLFPGPTIVGRIKFNEGGELAQRVTVEDLSFPLMYVDAARAAFTVLIGRSTGPADLARDFQEGLRRLIDIGAFNPELEKGALNHTMLYLVMGHDDAGGRLLLDEDTGDVQIEWPGAGSQDVFANENNLLFQQAGALGASFVENPLWGFTPNRTLVTAHPLGGCPMGESQDTGLVNDRGQVYDGQGALHEGLYIADGSIIPTAIGGNPFLTISALAEHIAEGLIVTMGGVPLVVDHL
jgi:cholesterol oxidase